jgi:tripartite-type tricarboxylate transporter receptor subunit TctC
MEGDDMLRKFASVAACLAAAAAAFPCTVSAQSDYPNKPLRLIVPFPPGGSTDIIGRIVAQRLGEKLGQQIVVDNRGGAGGTIGTDAAAKASPDGYTLAVGTTSTHAVAPGAYSKLGYDPIKDFAPVSLVAVTPYLLVVNAQVPAKSLKEFVTLAKSQPGKLNYASAGAGSTTHLAMEMLKDVAAINVVHIPYKGNGPAEVAVLAGEVQAIFGSMPALLAQVKANKLRPLAVGTARRSPAVPDVPTVAELGYPQFEAALWLGIVAPAGTPARVVERLGRELNAIVTTPDFREAMDKNGAEPIGNTPEQFATLIRQEADRYGKVVKALGIKLD